MVIFVLIFIFQNLYFPSIQTVHANLNSCYARVMFDQANLYIAPTDDDSFSNVQFELPKTYFVELLDNANEKFYYCKYMSFFGYVKKDCVQAVEGVPKNPYLENINFRVYSDQSRDMRTLPTTDNNLSKQIAYVPLYTKNLSFIGKIYGEEVIKERTNVWYYCKYSGDKDYFGYVYSDFCDKMTATPLNTEELTYIQNPTFNTDTSSSTMPENSKYTGVITFVLCLPAIAFLLLILKGKSLSSSKKSKQKEVVDY